MPLSSNQILTTIQLLVRLPGVAYVTLVVTAPDPSQAVYDSETRLSFTPGKVPDTLALPANGKSAVATAGGLVPAEVARNEASLLSYFNSTLKPVHRMQLVGLKAELMGDGDAGIHYRVEKRFKSVPARPKPGAAQHVPPAENSGVGGGSM